MHKEIMKTVQTYLDSIYSNENDWASHDDATYVYHSCYNDRIGTEARRADAKDLAWKGLLYRKDGGVIIVGPDEDIKLPLIFDYTKIRRRVEDTLRKSNNQTTLLRVAEILNVKLS